MAENLQVGFSDYVNCAGIEYLSVWVWVLTGLLVVVIVASIIIIVRCLSCHYARQDALNEHNAIVSRAPFISNGANTVVVKSVTGHQ